MACLSTCFVERRPRLGIRGIHHAQGCPDAELVIDLECPDCGTMNPGQHQFFPNPNGSWDVNCRRPGGVFHFGIRMPKRAQ